MNQPRKGRQNAPNRTVTPCAPPGLALINIETPGLTPGAKFYRAYGAVAGHAIKQALDHCEQQRRNFCRSHPEKM